MRGEYHLTVCSLQKEHVHNEQANLERRHMYPHLPNEEFYGLARSDFKSVHGKLIENWTPPDTAAINRNARRIRRFLFELKENVVEQM